MVAVDRDRIEEALAKAEAAVAAGAGLEGTGFWRAVAAVKSDPELAAAYGERIAAVDRAAFERWALLTLPIGAGTAIMAAGLVAGLVAVGFAYEVGEPGNAILLLVGAAVILVTTHGLTHLAVGRAFGMRFTHWFIGSLTRPQPGVKVDYATYLAAPARRRAWMHGSGAVTTKLVPFLLVGAAVAAGVPGWVSVVLVAVGILQLVTDAVWSVRSSDWKKFRREMSFADGDRRPV